jgi:Fic family protein
VLERPVLYLSRYLKRHRQQYYDRLQAVRDDGDWQGWLAFFLRGVAEVAGEATETARRVLLLRENNRAEITNGLGRAAANGHRVLESLFDRPIISVTEAQQLTGTGFAAANQLIARMTELGILREITGHARNRRFRYEPYVRLFTDDVAPDSA